MGKIKNLITDVALMMSKNHFMSFEDAMEYIFKNPDLNHWTSIHKQIEKRFIRQIIRIDCYDDCEECELLHKIDNGLKYNLDYLEGQILLNNFYDNYDLINTNQIEISVYNTSNADLDIIMKVALEKDWKRNFIKMGEGEIAFTNNEEKMAEFSYYWTLKKYLDYIPKFDWEEMMK